MHVSGYRDPVSTVVAAWCRAQARPYVFEPLGMVEPRLRKVALKRALDATLTRGVVRDARLVLVVSERERTTSIGAASTRDRIRSAATASPTRRRPHGLDPLDGVVPTRRP